MSETFDMAMDLLASASRLELDGVQIGALSVMKREMRNTEIENAEMKAEVGRYAKALREIADALFLRGIGSDRVRLDTIKAIVMEDMAEDYRTLEARTYEKEGSRES